MWHVLRTELAYLRSYLVGGLGLAVGVATLVSVIFYAVGEDGPRGPEAGGIRGMFLIMAPLIVGFIAQALRTEERRVRLLLAGPLTPTQLAGAAVLLPVVLLGIGVLAAAVVIGGEALVTGVYAVESLNIVGYVGGMIFMGLMIGLLIQETAAAHREGRRRAAALGWTFFGAAVLLFTGLSVASVWIQGPRTWPGMHLGNLILAVTSMALSVALYRGRTDFTR